MRISTLTFTILPLLLLSACVSSGKHEAALAEMDSMRQSLGSAREEINRNQQQIQKTEQELAAAKMQNALAQEEINRNQQQIQKTEQELKSARLQVVAAVDELMKLEARKKDLQQELSESQAQMTTLRNIEIETKRRNQIYENFVNTLKTMIDGGQLTVSIEQGRIVINLPNNVLFKSGSANLNPEGEEALTQIGSVLSQFSDRRFQIEGHTDNKPIKSAQFPSNWELSTSRALTVVHLLTDIDVDPENISAAGFGEFRPRADNETEEGRQLNRRIEIIMLPNLDILSNELPKVTP
ncbi:MAG: OmpA family protein [Gammaproteobacteria bacterium]|nr:OmpA family protein [Gammaproteobacteria bacterium]